MASPRAIAGTDPATPAVTDHPFAGRRELVPEVQVKDSVTKPFAAYFAAITTPING
jgi:hypothetical protein